MRNRLVALSVATLQDLSLAACSDDDTPTDPNAASSSKETGERPPPEDFARVANIVDDSVVYYAIKLDPKKPVTAVTIEISDYKPEILD